MATEAFTIRTESDIVKQLDYLAGSLDRSRNYLVNQALKEYLNAHAWQLEKIIQGIAVAERGELIDHDDVMQEMADIITSKTEIDIKQ
jgi:predicted transcriptional regulator